MTKPVKPDLVPYVGQLPDPNNPATWTSRWGVLNEWKVGEGHNNDVKVSDYNEAAINWIDAALLNSENVVDSLSNFNTELTALENTVSIGTVNNANTVNGVNASQFIRKDIAQEISNATEKRWRSGSALNDPNENLAALSVFQPSNSLDAFMSFHIAGRHAAYFGLDATINDLAVGGWSKGNNAYRIWHEGNDGNIAKRNESNDFSVTQNFNHNYPFRLNNGGFNYIEGVTQHIAQYKKSGGYGWYWRKTDTGLQNGANATELMRLQDDGHLWTVTSGYVAHLAKPSMRLVNFRNRSANGWGRQGGEVIVDLNKSSGYINDIRYAQPQILRADGVWITISG